MRNSVKVTIDAYDGTVDFFIFDKDDPLIKTYRAIFPALFKDETQMPADLRAHVRYPETMFRTQADVFGVYHVTDESVFFRRDDVWSVANQYTQNKDKQETAPLEPYFVLMQLPGEQTQNEFVEILPFTPAGRSNMTGWLAGRSDGKAYGSLLVYNFPKSRQIDGPTQIEARINQDPALSRSITLLNSGGSRLLRGNLLVIPIGRSILYVEPIFLLSESNAIPRLVLVVLATHERLEFGETTDADPRPPFDIAREKLFGKSGGTATQPKEQGVKPQPNASPTPSPSPSPQPAGAPNVQQLANRALLEFQEYQRLTSEGKLAEAGKKLEEHKRTLEELKKATGKP